jgi:transcriptional regulator with XRE-family HTH domain
MSEQVPERIADIAEQYAAFLAAEAPEPQLDDLTEQDRRRASEVCASLAVAWNVGQLDPGPLERDPVAVSLGLVPDPTRPLNGVALKQARLRSGLTVSALASRLRERAWDTRTADVYTWERQHAAAVPPAVIAALAEELAVPETRLIGSSAPVSAAVAAVTATSRFSALARRWAAAVGLGEEVRGAAALQQLMIAGVVRRGDELDTETWLAALEALVETRESSRDQP